MERFKDYSSDRIFVLCKNDFDTPALRYNTAGAFSGLNLPYKPYISHNHIFINNFKTSLIMKTKHYFMIGIAAPLLLWSCSDLLKTDNIAIPIR